MNLVDGRVGEEGSEGSHANLNTAAVPATQQDKTRQGKAMEQGECKRNTQYRSKMFSGFPSSGLPKE